MRTLAAFALVALACGASAAPIRLNDAPSPRSRIDVVPQWRYEGLEAMGPERVNAVVARAPGVEVRLDTAALVGRRGRIYLALPVMTPGLAAPDALRLAWSARGRMLPGAVLPGQRTLLYDGPIESPVTGDVLDFTLHLDARYTERGLRVEPYFEFEPHP